MLELKQKHFTLEPKTERFLKFFPRTLFTYIADNNPSKPVIHSEILDLNRQSEGYGIFFTVNGFTGGKRTSETLTNINAFFADIDFPDKVNKSPESIRLYKNDILMELYAEGKTPTAIVETKNGFHVYWILSQPVYLDQLNEDQQNRLRILYRDIEEAILKRFDGDPAAKDVARVLRVPGTLHQKDPNDPFVVKLVHLATTDGNEAITYKFSEIQEAFLKKQAPDTWAVQPWPTWSAADGGQPRPRPSGRDARTRRRLPHN